MDKVVIAKIESLQKDQCLETAPNIKKRRLWQSSKPGNDLRSQTPPLSSSSVALKTSPCSEDDDVPPAKIVKCEIEDLKAEPCSPPSYEEYYASPSPPSTLTHRSQHRRDETINNCGSDEDSDKSDGELERVSVLIPRTFRSMIETPLDDDTVADEDATIDPATDADSTPISELASREVPIKMTEKPWDLNDFDWREFPNLPIPPKSRRETFTEVIVGPKNPRADPYNIFVEIWDRHIIKHIASETNKYAQQLVSHMLEKHNLHPRSRISRWVDTTPDELYVYFGIILAMGIVIKSRMEEYWTATPDIFYTPGFSAHMSIDRFLILNKCLHFNDNNDMCALGLENSETRLFKIQPIVSHLNKKFQEMYTPAQNISIDESLLMWKGWLDIAQRIPNKTTNRGIKTYELCESQTGYLWRFEVHVNKVQKPRQLKDPLEDPIPPIILQLIRGLEHKGYTLWMDNFYHSPCLARRLKCLGFDCVGTLRTDRKFVPQDLNNLSKRTMTPGQIAGFTSGDVDVMVWRDSNRIAMISTYHGNGQQQVQGHTKPILILDYNIMMGGMDKKDQLLVMYPVERKRTKVWYKKFFRRLLNISVLNSYIIHHYSSSMSHRDFRISLVKSLLSKHCTPSDIPHATPQKSIDVTHRLGEFPMRNHQRMRRACTACKKQVRTFCVGCKKTVCMEPCFLKIHA